MHGHAGSDTYILLTLKLRDGLCRHWLELLLSRAEMYHVLFILQ